MRVPLTEDIKKEIAELREKTGLHPAALARMAKDDPRAAPGMTLSKIGHIVQGEVQTAYKNELETLLMLLREAPVIEFVAVTTDYINDLKAKIEQTRLGPQAAITQYKKRNEAPPWLKAILIDSVLAGKKDKLPAEQHALLSTLWDGLPEWMDLQTEHLDALRAEHKRTGRGGIAILKGAEDIPKGLYGQIVQNWEQEITKSARRHHYEFVMECYRNSPDRPAEGRVKRGKYKTKTSQK